MGFDLYGTSPSSKTGEYFRNNVWWWRPLADYVLDNCSDCMTEEENNGYWHTNDGFKISEVSADAIGKRLLKLIVDKHTQRYAKSYAQKLKRLPMVNCGVCKGTGKPTAIYSNKKICHNCNGTGKEKNFHSNYPFSTANVKEFAHFCMASGGFRIC